MLPDCPASYSGVIYMDKKDRRSVRLSETLSFGFSVLFAILSVIIITITGIYSYFDHCIIVKKHCPAVLF